MRTTIFVAVGRGPALPQLTIDHRQARRARGPAHRRQHRQAAGAAAELEVMTAYPGKLSQISEKARVKHDRIGAESRRLLKRGHLYEHLGHAVPLLRHPHERSGWAG
jgi:hypothetical protein